MGELLEVVKASVSQIPVGARTFARSVPELARQQAETTRAPGMEEYIEAISFLHYLEHGNLISLKEIQDHLTDRETSVPVRP